jgi:DNA-binding response OmpR family regulator
MIQILLVEDDFSIVSNLTAFLKEEGFAVAAFDGQTKALDWLLDNPCDLALLDISLVEGNGFATCNAIKRTKDIPVIFLTASGDEYSVVTGLDMGADDYVNKPFRPRELVSRINSVLRRYKRDSGNQEQVVIGNLVVDVSKAVVYKAQQEVFLSALEYRILLIFVNHRGQVLTRNQLLEEIWDIAGEFVNDNTLTVYIKRLREKIEDEPAKPDYIKTVRGIGYRMD